MTTTPARRAHDVPAAVRELCTLDALDYADHFTFTTPGPAPGTPEIWVRTGFEDIAGITGQVIFRVLVAFRLKWGRSPEHVAGWRIGGRGEGWIRLEAQGPLMDGQLVLVIDGGDVSLATFMRYRNGLGRRIWTRLSAVHRGKAPWLLGVINARLAGAGQDGR